ncbi:hypothetical protein BIV57_10500 [Mangrovactinospora gilvigrisea]|uniref:DUF3043 domain-containing protein n=1 Tax=Mangrovactinospora gilvigrisea TaxID=1428644 RepID=A0A1J7BVP8_9ACTN|nr:DUF3043 domain-containing protein [Mangrovactinospora gilvigrisea]OIV37545.1 hypothetical protein BIV57_10500 [Mangrovactinospora gilvigrisea]
MFGRKEKDESGATATAAAEDSLRGPQDKKGRPTPKRSEAQANRARSAKVPKDRREAAKMQRERMRTERMKQREGMLRGDERMLQPRDRGPVRRFARDYVDARFAVAEFFLPFAVVILVLSMVPNIALKNISLLLWLVLIVLIVLDSVRIKVGIGRALKEKFPDENHRGVGMYALMRTLQMRRMRLPKPQVKRGAKD